HLAVEDEAVLLGVFGVMEDLGRAQQGLGRDTAPIQADAAQVLALYDRGFEAELGRADRRNVAAGTGTDDEDVVGGHWDDTCEFAWAVPDRSSRMWRWAQRVSETGARKRLTWQPSRLSTQT